MTLNQYARVYATQCLGILLPLMIQLFGILDRFWAAQVVRPASPSPAPSLLLVSVFLIGVSVAVFIE